MNYLDYINIALEGAEYHEGRAFLLETKDAEYDKVPLYIRAYFWELLSIWDYILQQANIQTLNKSPDQVRGDFITEIENKVPQYKYIAALKTIRDDPRMKKIKFVRNYAHKWQYNPVRFMASIGEHPTEAKDVVAIALDNSDKKEKNLPHQISIDRSDLSFMKDSIKFLFDQDFFN